MIRTATLLIVIFSISAYCASAQDAQITSPEGWDKETFSLPPSFSSAQDFPFKGNEIIRFAPGWGRKGAPDYWSYAYLWIVEKSPEPATPVLEKALLAYYTGLVGSNITRRNIPKEKLLPATVHLQQNQDGTADWSGTVHMLDYMAQEPITLQIHLRQLPLSDQKQRSLFIEVSPVPPGQGIWQQLDTLVKAP